MVWSSAITVRGIMGANRMHMGTFENTAVTEGGDINTGLGNVVGIILTPNGAGVAAAQCSLNETLPTDGTTVAIKTSPGVDGCWIAWGN